MSSASGHLRPRLCWHANMTFTNGRQRQTRVEMAKVAKKPNKPKASKPCEIAGPPEDECSVKPKPTPPSALISLQAQLMMRTALELSAVARAMAGAAGTTLPSGNACGAATTAVCAGESDLDAWLAMRVADDRSERARLGPPDALEGLAVVAAEQS